MPKRAPYITSASSPPADPQPTHAVLVVRGRAWGSWGNPYKELLIVTCSEESTVKTFKKLPVSAAIFHWTRLLSYYYPFLADRPNSSNTRRQMPLCMQNRWEGISWNCYLDIENQARYWSLIKRHTVFDDHLYFGKRAGFSITSHMFISLMNTVA